MKLLDKIMAKIKGNREQERYCAAVIVAAGSSKRMGGVDKLKAELGGVSVIARTLTAFQNCAAVDEIILVSREDDLDYMASVCRRFGIDKCTAILPGGEERIDSVYAGAMAVPPETTLIAVQDGARPFVTGDIITAAVECAAKHGAAVPAVQVTDTIKRVKDGVVDETIDRAGVYAMQTPQVFDADVLKAAVQNAVDTGMAVTDDCMAVEALGLKPHTVEGSYENIKITTPFDLTTARAIVREREGV